MKTVKTDSYIFLEAEKDGYIRNLESTEFFTSAYFPLDTCITGYTDATSEEYEKHLQEVDEEEQKKEEEENSKED